MLQKIFEGFLQKYLREELGQDQELTDYLVLHDLEMQPITMQGSVYTKDPINHIIHITRKSAKATIQKARQIMEQRKATPASQPAALHMKAHPAQIERKGRVASLARGKWWEKIAKILNLTVDTGKAAGKAISRNTQKGLGWTGRRTQESFDYLSTQAQSATQQTAQAGIETAKLAQTGLDWSGQKTKESFGYLSTQTQSATQQTARTGRKAFELTKQGLTATGQWIKRNSIAGKDWAVEFSGFGPDKLYDAVEKTSVDKSAVKVDMNLDFYNFYDPTKKIKLFADLMTGCLFARRRWSNSVRLAAPKIANFANSGAYSVIEAPGINSAGLDKTGDTLPKLEGISRKLDIPHGKTLVICHSAGTEAGLRSMRLLDPKRRNQIYYLMLSPRMNPKRFVAFLQEANIARDHVMTVNSLLDLPHWPDATLKYTNEIAKRPFISWLARFIYGNTPKPWHDFEDAPETGVHVFLQSNQSNMFWISHGSMYEGLSNDNQFQISLNGKPQKDYITISELTKEFIKGAITMENDLK